MRALIRDENRGEDQQHSLIISLLARKCLAETGSQLTASSARQSSRGGSMSSCSKPCSSVSTKPAGAGRVRPRDSATLRNQLAGLERRVGAGDRDAGSHAQTASARDDVAGAAAGAFVLAASRASYDIAGLVDSLERLYGESLSRSLWGVPMVTR